MNYFDDVFGTCLGLDRVRTFTVFRRIRKLSDYIQNFLIWVPKINEGLPGLELHEDE